MNDWIAISAALLAIILFPVAVIYFLLALRDAWLMYQHMRGEWWVNLMGPFSLAVPQLFDEVGNTHRVLFLKRLAVAAISVGVLLLLREFSGVS